MKQSFARIKEIAAAAGFSLEKLADLTQASDGKKSGASKQHLLDAIDRQYRDMGARRKQEVVRYTIEELARLASPADVDRMADLLLRSGWRLFDNGLVLPLEVVVGVSSIVDDDVSAVLTKALERYRSGDLSGAVTAVVGAVEAVAGVEASSANHSQRVMEALRPEMLRVGSELSALEDSPAKTAKGALEKSTKQTVELLAAFRRNYSDVHGEPVDGVPKPVLFLTFHAATYVLNRLSMS